MTILILGKSYLKSNQRAVLSRGSPRLLSGVDTLLSRPRSARGRRSQRRSRSDSNNCLKPRQLSTSDKFAKYRKSWIIKNLYIHLLTKLMR